MKNAIAYFDPSHNTYGIGGIVRFHQCSPSNITQVYISFKGIKPGATHAIHIHEYGNLTEGCKSAGAHYNPFNMEHGSIYVDPERRHVGDLINNIKGDDKGEYEFTYLDPMVQLHGPLSVIGRTVVLHAKPDDLGLGPNKESKITGNAGDRIACSIIGIDK
jgi:Cu-Zn family superoxide dismutase